MRTHASSRPYASPPPAVALLGPAWLAVGTVLRRAWLAAGTVLRRAWLAAGTVPRALRLAAAVLLRALRGVGSTLAECDRINRRLSALRLSPDRYLSHPEAPPDTYAEFLARTSSTLLHEPSARARLAGRTVR